MMNIKKIKISIYCYSLICFLFLEGPIQVLLAQDLDKLSSLWLAIKENQEERFEQIISDPDLQTFIDTPFRKHLWKDKEKLLDLAFRKGRWTMARKLIEKKASFSSEQVQRVLSHLQDFQIIPTPQEEEFLKLYLAMKGHAKEDENVPLLSNSLNKTPLMLALQFYPEGIGPLVHQEKIDDIILTKDQGSRSAFDHAYELNLQKSLFKLVIEKINKMFQERQNLRSETFEALFLNFQMIWNNATPEKKGEILQKYDYQLKILIKALPRGPLLSLKDSHGETFLLFILKEFPQYFKTFAKRLTFFDLIEIKNHQGQNIFDQSLELTLYDHIKEAFSEAIDFVIQKNDSLPFPKMMDLMNDLKMDYRFSAGFWRNKFHFKLISKFLKEGGSTALTSSRGDTPLHLAATYFPGNLENLFQYYRPYPSEMGRQNREGLSPFHALISFHPQMASPYYWRMPDETLRSETNSGWSSLHFLANAYPQDLPELLKRFPGRSLKNYYHKQTKDGWTPLLLAVKAGAPFNVLLPFIQNFKLADFLKLKSKDGQTVFELAHLGPNPQLADQLLKFALTNSSSISDEELDLYLSSDEGKEDLTRENLAQLLKYSFSPSLRAQLLKRQEDLIHQYLAERLAQEEGKSSWTSPCLYPFQRPREFLGNAFQSLAREIIKIPFLLPGLSKALWGPRLHPPSFKNVLPTQCESCLEEHPREDFISYHPLADAGYMRLDHAICADCAKQHLEMNIKERNFPLKCYRPQCDGLVDGKNLLERVDTKASENLSTETLVQASRGILYHKLQHHHQYDKVCHTPDCKMIFSHRDVQEGHYDCPFCLNSNCTKCQRVHPRQRGCEAHDDPHYKNLHDPLNPEIRPCPHCESAVNKSAACDHIGKVGQPGCRNPNCPNPHPFKRWDWRLGRKEDAPVHYSMTQENEVVTLPDGRKAKVREFRLYRVPKDVNQRTGEIYSEYKENVLNDLAYEVVRLPDPNTEGGYRFVAIIEVLPPDFD